MIMLFTTAKPFAGHAAVSQYNTLACWRRLLPEAEVLLVGEEPGSAEVARELGVRLVPEVERSEAKPAPRSRVLFFRLPKTCPSSASVLCQRG